MTIRWTSPDLRAAYARATDNDTTEVVEVTFTGVLPLAEHPADATTVGHERPE